MKVIKCEDDDDLNLALAEVEMQLISQQGAAFITDCHDCIILKDGNGDITCYLKMELSICDIEELIRFRRKLAKPWEHD